MAAPLQEVLNQTGREFVDAAASGGGEQDRAVVNSDAHDLSLTLP